MDSMIVGIRRTRKDVSRTVRPKMNQIPVSFIVYLATKSAFQSRSCAIKGETVWMAAMRLIVQTKRIVDLDQV